METRHIALGSRRYGVPSGVQVQIGDIVTYTTFMGHDRRVLVNATEEPDHPRGMIFSGRLVNAEDVPLEGSVYEVWGYCSQVHTIKQPS